MIFFLGPGESRAFFSRLEALSRSCALDAMRRLSEDSRCSNAASIRAYVQREERERG